MSQKTVPLYISSWLWQMFSDFEIFSLLYSPKNLHQNACKTVHHTLAVSLQYLAKT